MFMSKVKLSSGNENASELNLKNSFSFFFNTNEKRNVHNIFNSFTFSYNFQPQIFIFIYLLSSENSGLS